ncbi:MAG: hypothetical protein QXU81_00150 [Candidatus Bathyarchaeia archaeon]
MKPALVEDYGNATYRSLARSVISNFLLENKRIPFVAAMDSTIIHYKPWSQIVFNPKVESTWKSILEKYYLTDEYKALNSAVAGDPMLSRYATIHFLNTLLKRGEEQLKRVKPDLTEKDEQNPVQALIELLDTQVSNQQTEQAIQALVSSLQQEAEEIQKDVEAIEVFSHVGIPVANFLEKPDEFRMKARNKIIINFVRFLRKLKHEAQSLKQTKSPTLVGGRPLGVKRIQKWFELPRAIATEHLDEDLFAYKVASKTLRVTEQYGSIQNYVVYLDKSGSMADNIPYRMSSTRTEYVPKISFAAASALALASRLKRFGAKMTLKLFDVEVQDPITDFSQLIETLLKIRADLGTNITNVLEDALKYRNDRVIVVTDGIDEISEEAVKKTRSANIDITCFFIKTDNDLLEKNFPCIKIEEAKPDVLLRI